MFCGEFCGERGVLLAAHGGGSCQVVARCWAMVRAAQRRSARAHSESRSLATSHQDGSAVLGIVAGLVVAGEGRRTGHLRAGDDREKGGGERQDEGGLLSRQVKAESDGEGDGGLDEAEDQRRFTSPQGAHRSSLPVRFQRLALGWPSCSG